MTAPRENGQRARGGRIKTRTARRERSEQTELQLLRATTWLFSERGFHGTGIRDIAEAAEVAVSAMYYYASSKDELLEAIMHRSLDVLIANGRDATSAAASSAEGLAALLAAHVAFHARNPRAARVVDNEFNALHGDARQEIMRKRDEYEALWRRTLDDGVRDGHFTDYEGVARLALLQMATGVAHWYRSRGKLTVPALCEQFAAMGLALVGAHSAGEPLATPLPDAKLLQRRVELPIEPRRRPAGL